MRTVDPRTPLAPGLAAMEGRLAWAFLCSVWLSLLIVGLPSTIVGTAGAQELCGGSFTSQSTFSVGTNPFTMVVRDLESDGDSDIVTANGTALSVSVLRNDGGRQFHLDPGYYVGARLIGMDAGDLNNDGLLDVVAACTELDKLAVLWGQPGDTLGGLTFIQVAQNPFEVKVRDLDLDGNLDAAVLTGFQDSIQVIWGDGAGGVGVRGAIGVPFRPQRMAVGDINSDGRPDIVVTSCSDTVAYVLPGAGGRSFGAPIPAFRVPSLNPCEIALGDLNNDGLLDIAATGHGSPTLNRPIPLGLGTGSGDFLFTGAPFAGESSSGVDIEDVNLDGHGDVVVSNSSSYDVTVLAGGGDGTTGPTTTIPTGGCPDAIAVADLDGDQRPDIIAMNCSSTITVTWNDEYYHAAEAVIHPSTHQLGGTGGVFNAEVRLPPEVHPRIDRRYIRLESNGVSLGEAVSASVVDSILGEIDVSFDKSLLDALAPGVHQVVVKGCDDVGKGFRGASDVRVIRRSQGLLWQDSPVGAVPLVIGLAVPPGTTVDLDLYDCRGRLVRRLKTQSVPDRSITWDGHLDGGGEAPSGLYVARVRGGMFQGAGKVILLR